MANIADFLSTHSRAPERVLYRHFAQGAWVDFTVHALQLRVARWQEALRRYGLIAGDRVAICLKNSVDWVVIDQAALGLGMVVVPLYVDDNAENIAYCVSHSQAKLLVVENARIGNALLRVAGDVLPDDKPPASAQEESAFPLTLCAKVETVADDADTADNADGGQLASPDLPRAHLASVASFLPPQSDCPPATVLDVSNDTLATICYTSGTSGRPKGVMLSHGNIRANVQSCQQLGIARSDDTFLSFLPLSHMFERTGGYYLPLSLGAKVVFARSVTQLPDDLREQKPTVIFAVPRIFEKFAARIEKELQKDDQANGKKRKIFERVVRAGWAKHRGEAGIVDHFMVGFLRQRAAANVLDKLGGRLRLAVVGGAALDPQIARLFIGLGLPILHGYGMTEAAPVVAVNRPLAGTEPLGNDPESVGPALPGIEVKLSSAGELLVRGANVMQGYFGDPAATARVLHDGWLSTGDLAEIRDDRIYIRGRLKDVLVLSNGEKLPPQDVELAILGDDLFEQGILVGEGKPFLTWLTVSQEADERLLMRRANDRLKAFPRYVRVRRVLRSATPWSVDNGLLTPTLKVKRTQVLAQFAAQIELVYREGGSVE